MQRYRDVTYVDAESAIREAREQGAEEAVKELERLRDLSRLQKEASKEGSSTQTAFSAEQYALENAIQNIKARGATEPVCTCDRPVFNTGPSHAHNCPCYKPPEMKCTCPNDWNPHVPGCPFYQPPPLSHNFDPDSFHDAVDAIYEIRAEIAKLRGRA